MPLEPNPILLRPLADSTELIRLRWAVVAGQLAAVGVTAAAGKQKEATGLLIVVLIGAASNLVASRRSAPTPQLFLVLLIALDVLLITAMMALTGGALSPLIPLYVVYPVLGAIVLQPGLAWFNFAFVMVAHASLVVFLPWGSQLTRAQAPVTGHVWGLFRHPGRGQPVPGHDPASRAPGPVLGGSPPGPRPGLARAERAPDQPGHARGRGGPRACDPPGHHRDSGRRPGAP